MPRAWRLPNPTQLCESIVTDFFSSVAASSAEVPFSLPIPDTVVFKYGRPIARYRSTNSAVQRTADLESASEILASMVRGQRVRPPSRRPPPHGPVVAYYVEEPGRQSQHGGRGLAPSVRYFDEAGLREFLVERQPGSTSGVLQRFLEPSSSASDVRHSLVRVLWSPYICHIEACTNTHQIRDDRLPPDERAATFDAESHESRNCTAGRASDGASDGAPSSLSTRATTRRRTSARK